MKNSNNSPPGKVNILLADDDVDDCLLFKEALEELQLQFALTLAHDGEQLLQLLTKNSNEIFDILFLDLNMPRKNGFECLEEIQRSGRLKSLPIVIFSTSYAQRAAELLYKNGAHLYIRKPAGFSELKKVIQEALLIVSENDRLHPPKESFHFEV